MGIQHIRRRRSIVTMAAFYAYVTAPDGAFRLVFESDLTNEPAVRAQVEEHQPVPGFRQEPGFGQQLRAVA